MRWIIDAASGLVVHQRAQKVVPIMIEAGTKSFIPQTNVAYSFYLVSYYCISHSLAYQCVVMGGFQQHLAPVRLPDHIILTVDHQVHSGSFKASKSIYQCLIPVAAQVSQASIAAQLVVPHLDLVPVRSSKAKLTVIVDHIHFNVQEISLPMTKQGF